MSDDIVEKLKRIAEAKDWGTGYGVELTLREAADEIERLRAAVVTAKREALEEAAKVADDFSERASEDLKTASEYTRQACVNRHSSGISIASRIRALSPLPAPPKGE